jgi:hypothetical protein
MEHSLAGAAIGGSGYGNAVNERATRDLSRMSGVRTGPILLQPLAEVLVPGKSLTADEVAEIREGLTRRDTWLADSQAQVAALQRQLDTSRAYTQELLRSLRAPILGYGVQDGPMTGMFPDGWVSSTLRLRVLPRRPVTGLILNGWIPKTIPPDGELRLIAGGQVAALAMEPGTFGLAVDLPQAADEAIEVVVEASVWSPPEETDRRVRASVLQALELRHPG